MKSKKRKEALELRLIIPVPKRDGFDGSSIPATIKHYCEADIKGLLVFAEPYYAGPLYYAILNAITGISSLYYGFSNPKRSFIKFVTLNMNIQPELADLLYLCKKAMTTQGMWPRHLALTANMSDFGEICTTWNHMIGLKVILLGKQFLDVLDTLDPNDMTTEIPSLDKNGIWDKALDYLKGQK